LANDSILSAVNKTGELKRRLLFVLGALIVYRLGAHIPVPGINAEVLAKLFESQSTGILGMFNMFSGGALSRFTVFALGIMPYISASIIMQLMTVVSPQLEQLKKEGEAGRRQITKYTRYGTVLLATFQALGIAIALESQAGLVLSPGFVFRITTVVTLVCGTMFLMWLGEQITERGIGNGISVIIFAGIVAGLPHACLIRAQICLSYPLPKRVDGAVADSTTASTAASLSFSASDSSSATILIVDSGSILRKVNRAQCSDTLSGNTSANSGSCVVFDEGNNSPNRFVFLIMIQLLSFHF